ncbi:MAG: leucine-rich repeat protein [Clostridia bacterium]|nr:leucine-rich repeat protein [Clostridia bacterium]
MKKRILHNRLSVCSSLLALLFAISLFSSCSEPEYAIVSEGNRSSDGLIYSLYENGSAVITGSDTREDMILTVPATADGHRVTRIADEAFYGRTDIYALIVMDCGTVGKYAFSSCPNLTYAHIGGVSALEAGAFCDCSNLTECSGTGSLKSIGPSAFSGCLSLTSLSLPEKLKSIGSDAFSGCTSLSSVVLPGSVKSFGVRVFFECTSLAYADVSSLGSIPDYTFTKCTSLVFPVIGKVSSIGKEAFRSCTSLETVYLPKSLKTVGEDAFGDCGSLTSVSYGGKERGFSSIDFTSGNEVCTRSFISYGSKPAGPLDFSRTPDKSSYTSPAFIAAGKEEYTCGEFTYLLDSDGKAQITSYFGSEYEMTVPEELDGHEVISIGQSAFVNNPILLSVDLGNRITSVGETAFYCCTSLREVKNGGSVRLVGVEAFGNTPWISSFGSLDFVIAFDSVLLAYNGSSRFIRVPDGTKSVAGGLLLEKSDTVFVYLPSSVRCLGPQAFSFCDKLKLVYGASVAEAGDACFSYCTSMPSADLPSLSVTGSALFSDCYNLRHADLGSLITRLLGGLFYYDQNLRIICVPASVTEIRSEIIDSCMPMIFLYEGTAGRFSEISVENGDYYLSDMFLIAKEDRGIAGK